MSSVNNQDKPSLSDEELNGSDGEVKKLLDTSEEEDGLYLKSVEITKIPNEPLGITLKVENGELMIARILGGSVIEKQSLLAVGDIIREVNGNKVFTPEQVLHQLKKAADDTISLKVIPADNITDTQTTTICYMKALFAYDPKKDTLIPCPEIGLPFKHGEILEIRNQEDPNWWQAKKIGIDGLAGLIPSQELEERRKAFVRPEYDYATKTSICGTRVAKKKVKQMYISKDNFEFDKAELLFYEEVTKIPPMKRKVLMLVGAEGVGRNTIKNKLTTNYGDYFATVKPYTSRPPREGEIDGESYHFVTHNDMEDDINQGIFLEYGEYNSFLYGIKLESIRNVMQSDKICVLDCNPHALKWLRNGEFMPVVIFVAAPSIDYLRAMHSSRTGGGSSMRSLSFSRSSTRSRRAQTMESLANFLDEDDLMKIVDESARIQRAYEKYFDVALTNTDSELACQQIMQVIEFLNSESQWVPVSWVY